MPMRLLARKINDMFLHMMLFHLPVHRFSANSWRHVVYVHPPISMHICFRLYMHIVLQRSKDQRRVSSPMKLGKPGGANFSSKEHYEKIAVFGARRSSPCAAKTCGINLAVRRLHLCAALRQQARTLRRALTSAKTAEGRRQIESLPEDCPASQILHKLKSIVGTTTPKHRRSTPLPAILDEQGLPCATPETLVDRWVEFFNIMEGGERLQEDVLCSEWIENLQGFLQTEMFLTPEAIPTLTDLEIAFRRVKPHKAVGEDCIPPEVCHLHPAWLARLTCGQLLKLCTHGQEALVHKGGVLVAAWKRKGSKLQCESYRSLLISSHIAKTVHRAVRDHQSSVYDAYLQKQQIGGRRHIPVSMGVHFIRAAARASKRMKQSHALIFLDLREASYRVLHGFTAFSSWWHNSRRTSGYSCCTTSSSCRCAF